LRLTVRRIKGTYAPGYLAHPERAKLKLPEVSYGCSSNPARISQCNAWTDLQKCGAGHRAVQDSIWRGRTEPHGEPGWKNHARRNPDRGFHDFSSRRMSRYVRSSGRGRSAFPGNLPVHTGRRLRL